MTTSPPIERDRVGIELGLIEPHDGYKHPRWKRSRRGGTVHHYDCPRAANGLAWFWPEGRYKTDWGLLKGMPGWLHLCKVCFPPAVVERFELVKFERVLLAATRSGREGE